ncbi:MAG: DedA family protein [Bacilli bacterium]|nr:DedA family protein [Bacilli bacterium]
MQQFVVSFMDQFGYMGILLLIMIENLFPPIPSEVILAFGGFMTTYSSMNLLGVILFSTLGSLLGAIILYFVGYILNKDRLSKIVSGRIGKLLRLKSSDIEKADGMFLKSGKKTVFFARFVPIVRSLISIPAGMSKMPFVSFVVYTTLGTIIWNSVLVIIGRMLGSNWIKVVSIINEYSSIVLIVLAIVFAIIILYKVFFKKRVNVT